MIAFQGEQALPALKHRLVEYRAGVVALACEGVQFLDRLAGHASGPWAALDPARHHLTHFGVVGPLLIAGAIGERGEVEGFTSD